MAKIKKAFRNRKFLSVSGMLLGTMIYCFSVVFVLDKGQFYTGGITGVAQIFANLFKVPILKSILIASLNLPLFIMGWKNVSKRFAVLSLSSVILQVLIIMLFDYFKGLGFDPFKDIVATVPVVDENLTIIAGKTYETGKLVLVIIGGILCGLGCGITLRSGSSTGGLDIIAQSFSMKTGIPFIVITVTIDLIIIFAGSIIGGSVMVGVYTLMRLIIHMITLDSVHTIYKYQKITCITDKGAQLQEELVKRFLHGVTVYNATGAYSGKDKVVLETIVLTYEVEDYRNCIKEIDSCAFVYHTAVKGIMGRYTRRAIN